MTDHDNSQVIAKEPQDETAAAAVTWVYDHSEAKGTVTIAKDYYGPGFNIKAPDGTEYTGFIDLFHFAGDEDNPCENCLQIVVDPVDGEGPTFHVRFYPDGPGGDV